MNPTLFTLTPKSRFVNSTRGRRLGVVFPGAGDCGAPSGRLLPRARAPAAHGAAGALCIKTC